MMDSWGNAPRYGNLNQEQWNQLEQLDRRFSEETASLRKDLWAKSSELNAQLNTKDPDLNKARTLQKEIGDLRAKLDEKQLDYKLEARKINPDSGGSGGYYGHHMGAYDHGMGYGSHMRDYGPGSGPCWY